MIAEYSIGGLQCTGCVVKIESKYVGDSRVDVKVNYGKSIVRVEYDETEIDKDKIVKEIEELGYKLDYKRSKAERFPIKTIERVIQIVLLVAVLDYVYYVYTGTNLLVVVWDKLVNLVVVTPEIPEGSGYIVLLLIGVLSSFHCVAMCGGINVTQCVVMPSSEGRYSNNMKYNLGRVVSYTVIGGLVGGIGKVLTLTVGVTAYVNVVVGICMVIMGLNLAGVRVLRGLQPRIPSNLRGKFKVGNTAFMIGLLNGFMPCGPLQTMQIYALSTGSIYKGALSMFFFSVGTVPMVYLLGRVGSVKGKNLAGNFMKVSGLLVVVMGLVMGLRGLSMLGIAIPSVEIVKEEEEVAGRRSEGLGLLLGDKMESIGELGGDKLIETELEISKYPDLVVNAGDKVKWVINAESGNLNGCNNRLLIPEYGIDKVLEEGENIIEFTAGEAGRYRYSCWMGMIRADIVVK